MKFGCEGLGEDANCRADIAGVIQIFQRRLDGHFASRYDVVLVWSRTSAPVLDNAQGVSMRVVQRALVSLGCSYQEGQDLLGDIVQCDRREDGEVLRVFGDDPAAVAGPE